MWSSFNLRIVPQKEKNDDARHGDIQPEGERKFCNSAMGGSSVSKAEKDGRENHRESNHRKHDMCDQNKKVNRSNPALTQKFGIPLLAVVVNVTYEKQC